VAGSAACVIIALVSVGREEFGLPFLPRARGPDRMLAGEP
jgi:hypothetical protein